MDIQVGEVGCMVWYGMVWYGMVWYGMVWYGTVRYGTVSRPVITVPVDPGMSQELVSALALFIKTIYQDSALSNGMILTFQLKQTRCWSK